VIYGVKDWRTLYENADTRRRKNLGWVLTPNRHDSMAFGTLMAKGSEGLKIFGAWMVLLQLSSRGPYQFRGILCDSDGHPYTIAAMAVKTRVLICDLQLSIPVLVDLGWMYGKNTQIYSIYGQEAVSSVDSDGSSVDLDDSTADSCSKYKKKYKKKKPPLVGEGNFPPSLKTKCFEEAWEKWQLHLGERYGGASLMQLEGHLAMLANDVPEVAAERLTQAIDLGFRMPCQAGKISAPPPEPVNDVSALKKKIQNELK